MRLIGSDGSQIGVVPTHQARSMAEQQGLDLVEISPSAVPPVCRIMNFGKFKYEQEKKDKEARKHQSASRVKEVKFHANVEDHDYQTKLRHTRDFVAEGHRVKVSLFFRGRENAHQELGYEVMNRVMRDCEDIAMPEQVPTKMGRALQMMLGPKRGARKDAPRPATAAPSAPRLSFSPVAPEPPRAPAPGGPPPPRP